MLELKKNKFEPEISDELKDKLLKVKVFLTDVDGVLTEGKIYYAGELAGGFMRSFNANDGFGMRMLKKAGFQSGFISGGKSRGVFLRGRQLQLDYMFLGNEDKRQAYDTILEVSGLKDENILYLGDESFDVPLLERAGFSAAPPHSAVEVLNAVDYVTKNEAGNGCVREVIDLLFWAHKVPSFVPTF